MGVAANDEAKMTAQPVSCWLDAAELAARSAILREELFRHALEREELPDGVRFRFPGAAEFQDKLLAFVAAERTCCAFFRIELAFEASLGPIWLTLTGPAGVKAFVRQRFEGYAAETQLPAERAPHLSR